MTPRIWTERFDDVVNYERYLARQGVIIRKFFLYVSKEEQRRRFLDRLREPEKHWKFSLGDVHEREHFDDYLGAYEDAIRRTATPHAPWYVVPADHKWFTRLVVASAVIDAIESVRPTFPISRRGHPAEAAGGADGARKRGPAAPACAAAGPEGGAALSGTPGSDGGRGGPSALRVVRHRPAVRRLSRRRVGPAGRGRPAVVREDLP